jgi:competence ComEA-like helix-hairpin-helix protein
VKPHHLLALASAMFTSAFGVTASTQARPPARPDVLQKSVGEMTAEDEDAFTNASEATIERVCIACHPFDKIVKTRRTVREWSEQVTLMKGRGAPGTDADFTLVTRYLPRYYGVVAVNTAPAEELTAVLGLSAKDASGVVEYRKTHGDFADLASLERVDGIDKAKLEEQPEAIRFTKPGSGLRDERRPRFTASQPAAQTR